MAAMTVSVHIDTTKLKHWTEFMDASLVVDQLLDLPVEPEPGALSRSLTRWREALRLLRGEVRVASTAGFAGERV